MFTKEQSKRVFTLHPAYFQDNICDLIQRCEASSDDVASIRACAEKFAQAVAYELMSYVHQKPHNKDMIVEKVAAPLLSLAGSASLTIWHMHEDFCEPHEVRSKYLDADFSDVLDEVRASGADAHAVVAGVIFELESVGIRHNLRSLLAMSPVDFLRKHHFVVDESGAI